MKKRMLKFYLMRFLRRLYFLIKTYFVENKIIVVAGVIFSPATKKRDKVLLKQIISPSFSSS